MCHTPYYILLLVVFSSSFLFITALSLSRNGRNQSKELEWSVVDDWYRNLEGGGGGSGVAGGFRLGVGVKSLVGSASAWSVKGGFLLLPAIECERERETQKVLTLLRNWRKKETVVINTDFYCRYLFCALFFEFFHFGFFLLTCSMSLSSSTSSRLPSLACACVCGSS